MANQSDIRAGRAFVEVFTDDSELKKGLLAINKEMDAWAGRFSSLGMRAMAAAGAVSVPFAAGIKIFSDYGDQIEKMTYRTGMSSEALSELAYVADLSGTSIKAIEIAIKGMQKTLSGAADESGTAEGKLAKLGLVLTDLADKTPEEQFFTLIERLGQIEDSNIRAAAALSLFGKSGTQLLPIIEDGAEEIATLREEARKLGVSLAQDLIWNQRAVGSQLSPGTFGAVDLVGESNEKNATDHEIVRYRIYHGDFATGDESMVSEVPARLGIEYMDTNSPVVLDGRGGHWYWFRVESLDKYNNESDSDP